MRASGALPATLKGALSAWPVSTPSLATMRKRPVLAPLVPSSCAASTLTVVPVSPPANGRQVAPLLWLY
jgi:hypothetical protein